jgi:hypothetical protein
MEGRWDGVLEISGIHTAFHGGRSGFIDLSLANRTRGSGVPIAITDQRYGMNNERVMVREVVYNFRDLTCKINIGNYTIANDNAILDNSKMSLVAGNIATGTVNENLLRRQYILERFDNPVPVLTSATIQIRLNGVVESTPMPAMVLHFPRLKMTLLSAHFSPSTFGALNHAVTDVRYNNVAYRAIKPSRRPDKNTGQSLIINIQIRHP